MSIIRESELRHMNEKTKKSSDKKSFFSNNKYHIIMTCVILIYTIVSFINLGDMDGPKTYADFKDGESAVFEFLEDRVPAYIAFFTGHDSVFITVSLADEYTRN